MVENNVHVSYLIYMSIFKSKSVCLKFPGRSLCPLLQKNWTGLMLLTPTLFAIFYSEKTVVKIFD